MNEQEDKIARLSFACEVLMGKNQALTAELVNVTVDLMRERQQRATATAAAKPKRGRPRKAPEGVPTQE